MPSEEKQEIEAAFPGAWDIVLTPLPPHQVVSVSKGHLRGRSWEDLPCPWHDLHRRLDSTDCRHFMAFSRMSNPVMGGRDGLFYLPVPPTSEECALMGHSDLETQSSVWEKGSIESKHGGINKAQARKERFEKVTRKTTGEGRF